MGGQAGGRGYLLQTMICVLKSLDDLHWDRVTLEPDNDSEKVDIVWEYEGKSRAVQVKSSQNQIDMPSVKKWADDLEKGSRADELELWLLGPCSGAVSSVGQLGKVKVPTPAVIDVVALSEQAAQKLDRFLRLDRISRSIGPLAREIVVRAMSHRFAEFSTVGRSVPREEFEELLRTWVVSLQPPVSPSRLARNESDVVARQLISPPHDFVGRDSDVQELVLAIEAGSRLIGIRGMPGIGKSALASKVAEKVSVDFSGCHIQLDLRGHTSRPVTSQEAMRHVIQATTSGRDIPSEQQALEGLYRSLLRDKKAILLFENVSDEQTLVDLDPRSESLVLFTSRSRFATPGLICLDLSPLDEKSSVNLLLSVAPRLGERARGVAQLCGCLPLALKVAACSFAERPDVSAGDFLSRLLEKRAVLEFVEASIQLSYDLLESRLRSWMCLLSLFPADFDVNSCAAVLAVDQRTADSVLSSLLRQSLIEWDEVAARYWMHDLVSMFAADHGDEANLSAGKWRFCGFFRDVCFGVQETYKRGHDEMLDAMFVFDCERSNIEAAASWLSWRSLEDQKAAEWCVDYVMSTTLLRDLRQHPLERIQWLEMGFEAALLVPDSVSALSCLGNTARALADLGEFDKALSMYRDSLEASRQFQLRGHECVSHIHIGNMLMVLGNDQSAISHFDEAGEIAIDLVDKSLEGQALAGAGKSHLRLGELEMARDKGFRASSVFADLGDQLNFAKSIANLADVSLALGEPEVALDMCEHSLGIVEDLDDPLSRVQIGGQLGETLSVNGEFDRSISAYQQSVEIAKRIGLVRFVFSGLRSLAVVYQKAGLPREADDVLAEHDAVADAIGDARAKRDGNQSRASVFALRGEIDTAIHILKQELDLIRGDEDLDSEISVLSSMANFYADLRDQEKRISCMKRICEIAKETGHPLREQLEKELSEM